MSRTKRRKNVNPGRSWTHDLVFPEDGSVRYVPFADRELRKSLAAWHGDANGGHNAPAHFRRDLERRKRARYRRELRRALRPAQPVDWDVVLLPWRHDVNWEWF